MQKLIVLIAFLSLLMFSCHEEVAMESSTEINWMTSFEEDTTYLDSLNQEIIVRAGSFDCVNAAEWTFTAMGSRACGGPEMYIAYSTKLDTVAFLNLVKLYTDSQSLFNTKWGIGSICAIVTPPKGVECVNGLPVFIY